MPPRRKHESEKSGSRTLFCRGEFAPAIGCCALAPPFDRRVCVSVSWRKRFTGVDWSGRTPCRPMFRLPDHRRGGNVLDGEFSSMNRLLNARLVLAIALLTFGGCHRPSVDERQLIGTWQSTAAIERHEDGSETRIPMDPPTMEVTFTADHEERTPDRVPRPALALTVYQRHRSRSVYFVASTLPNLAAQGSAGLVRFRSLLPLAIKKRSRKHPGGHRSVGAANVLPRPTCNFHNQEVSGESRK